jgi:hypothetical protein
MAWRHCTLNINIISVYPSDAPISSISRFNMADLEVLITVITPESGGDVARHNNRYVSADHTTSEASRSPAWAVETIQYIRHWQIRYTDCVGTLYLYLIFRRQERQVYKYMYIYSVLYFIVIHTRVLLYIYNNISPQKTKLFCPYFHFN